MRRRRRRRRPELEVTCPCTGPRTIAIRPRTWPWSSRPRWFVCTGCGAELFVDELAEHDPIRRIQ